MPVVSRGYLYLRGKSDEPGKETHRLACYELVPGK
jgi:hypothetical protein